MPEIKTGAKYPPPMNQECIKEVGGTESHKVAIRKETTNDPKKKDG